MIYLYQGPQLDWKRQLYLISLAQRGVVFDPMTYIIVLGMKMNLNSTLYLWLSKYFEIMHIEITYRTENDSFGLRATY